MLQRCRRYDCTCSCTIIRLICASRSRSGITCSLDCNASLDLLLGRNTELIPDTVCHCMTKVRYPQSCAAQMGASSLVWTSRSADCQKSSHISARPECSAGPSQPTSGGLKLRGVAAAEPKQVAQLPQRQPACADAAAAVPQGRRCQRPLLLLKMTTRSSAQVWRATGNHQQQAASAPTCKQC